MNGDGVEELIVGAPLFVNTMETAAGNTLVINLNRRLL
jgi:hypothetical protein